MKKKVLFFLPPEIGGAERVSITISQLLSDEQYDVEYVIIGRKSGNIHKYLPSGRKLNHIKTRNIWDFTTTKVFRLLKQKKPEFTFSSNMYLNVRILLASHMVGGIRSIVRNDNGLLVVRWDNKLLMKLTYPWAYKIIAQQDEMREELLKVMHFSEHKVVTLHNPLNTALIDEQLKASSPYKDNDANTKYVWVGRIARTKGQDVLVKAFSLVHQQNPNTELYFIGRITSQDYYDEVNEIINKFNLQNSIHFVGSDENPFRWIKYADCFVLPSRCEGLPNSLIEAMYIGKPVVATRCIPVVDRIVSDGYNGYVVNPEDPEAMAETMRKAIKLQNFSMTYKPTSSDTFIKLFE